VVCETFAAIQRGSSEAEMVKLYAHYGVAVETFLTPADDARAADLCDRAGVAALAKK
jgi:hypothetical protein